MYVQRLAQTMLGFLLGVALLFTGAGATLSAQTPDLGATSHTVGGGETLSEIADAHGLDAATLMQINGIANADAIFEGQVLVLPNPAPAEVNAQSNDQHTILAGETLSQIAKRYDLSVEALMSANDIVNPDAIVVGQVLSLPPAQPTGPRNLLPTDRRAPDIASVDDIPIPADARRPATSLNRTYTIEPGDTPARIALRMGVDENALRTLNGMQDGSASLLVGDELLLPATGRELRISLPAQEYTVQGGDSLGSIARQHATTLTELLQVNNLADPDAIVAGQQVIIPPRIKEDAEGRASPKVRFGRNGFYHYTVRQGDTLSDLARDFESTILALLEYNDLPDEATVYTGLELRIPYGAPDVPQRLPPVPLSGTRFMVSLSRQQCWIFQGDTIKHTWACSTGYGEWITRTGTFAVQSKLEMAQSSGLRLDMPYWLGIYDVGDYENGIHGLPVDWDTGEKIWTSLIGEPATFGCAMLADDDALMLFNLAYLGMPVHIVN